MALAWIWKNSQIFAGLVRTVAQRRRVGAWAPVTFFSQIADNPRFVRHCSLFFAICYLLFARYICFSFLVQPLSTWAVQ